MTNDELRLAIAKAKGWKYLPLTIAPFWTGEGYVEASDWPEDIGAAWELVEEMRADKAITYVYLHGCDNGRVMPGKEYYVELSSGQCAYADTAPRAICMAWLKWQEGKRET